MDWNIANNILLIALLVYLVFYMLVHVIERRKKEHLLNLHVKKNSAQKLGERIQVIQDLYHEIDTFLKRRGHTNIADLVFYGVIVAAIGIFIAMAFTGQYLLAVLYPIVFIWFIRKMIKISEEDPIVEMEEALPTTIDNMIRIFSKHSDIKSIIYESTLVSSGPLQKELDWLSRQMNSKNPMVVLEEFSEKYDSVWLNNFAFILMGYLEDSSKDETVRNLRHLRIILEQENTTKKNAISERKPSILINYTLALIGVVGAIANIVVNPTGFNFFFHSYTGLFCFTAGFGFIMATIYMNIRMMKIEK